MAKVYAVDSISDPPRARVMRIPACFELSKVVAVFGAGQDLTHCRTCLGYE